MHDGPERLSVTDTSPLNRVEARCTDGSAVSDLSAMESVPVDITSGSSDNVSLMNCEAFAFRTDTLLTLNEAPITITHHENIWKATEQV